MKATLLLATALLFTASAQAQQNIETQQPALERNATAPSVEAASEAPGEMATLISSQTGSTSLRMYPVPTTGAVTADCPDGMLTIEVRDLNGRLVLRDNALNGAKRLTFDIGRVGTYIVDVVDRSGRQQRSRFIRQ